MSNATPGSDNRFADIDPILVVEDNPVNQKIAMILLNRLWVKAELAANGQEAVDMFSKGKYSLILMDCQLPVMDGFSATRAIREIENANKSKLLIPIIAVTALAMTGDRERCVAAGMDDYLSKPIDKAILTSKMEYWLSAKPARQLAPESSTEESESQTGFVDSTVWDSYTPGEKYGLAETFATSVREMLKYADYFVGKKDLSSIERVVEELKASATAIGAENLAAIIALLEFAASENEWTEAKTRLSEAKSEFEAVLKTINRIPA